jgi:cell wall-associated NlpC family hydrolase
LRSTHTRVLKAVGLAAAAAVLALPATAAAGTGGTSPPGSGSGGGSSSDTVYKAHMEGSRAVPHPNTPRRIKEVLWAGNRIRHKPYEWGGGHGRWEDNGYDCSGAVSYALHGGDFVSRPRTSGGFMSWGVRGVGRYITVYANGGHVYAKIAGLRWDTSMVPGSGPGWSTHMRSSSGFVKRHYNSRF